MAADTPLYILFGLLILALIIGGPLLKSRLNHEYLRGALIDDRNARWERDA